MDAIKGGVIPREFIPAVDKGIRESLLSGVLAGYPVVDVRATLTFGSFHDVDSNENAFRVAGSMAFKEGMRRGAAQLLEPIMAQTNLLPVVGAQCKPGQTSQISRIAQGSLAFQ